MGDLMRILKMEIAGGLALILAPGLAFAEAHAMDDHSDHDDHMDAPVAEMMGINEMPVQRAINLFCRFETECVEDEACAASAFEVALTGRAGGLEEAQMAAAVTVSTLSSTDESLGAFDNGVLSIAGGSIDARFLLTVTGDGARYTQHYGDGPMVISYLGACE